jgi:hypothetical protein
MSGNAAATISLTDLEESFFRAGDELSAAHEAETSEVEVSRPWGWLVVVPAVAAVIAFVVV